VTGGSEWDPVNMREIRATRHRGLLFTVMVALIIMAASCAALVTYLIWAGIQDID
jgi:hypothetical protein